MFDRNANGLDRLSVRVDDHIVDPFQGRISRLLDIAARLHVTDIGEGGLKAAIVAGIVHDP